MLMALQKVLAISISVSARHVSGREGSFKLEALLGLPPLSLVDMLHVIGGFQWISGSLTSMWPTSFGLLLAWTLVLAPLFLFISLSWVPSYEVWQGFIIRPFTKEKTVLDQFETPCQTEYDLWISLLS
jgi:hypothetical protein